MTERRRNRADRAADKVRGEAYRLAFERAFPTSAAIEAHLKESGWADVATALTGMHDKLDRIITAKRPSGVGIIGMFITPEDLRGP